jgi:hypothetical protein
MTASPPPPDLVARYSWAKAGPLLAFFTVLAAGLTVFGIADGSILALAAVPILVVLIAYLVRNLARRTAMVVVAPDRLEFRGMRLEWSAIRSITAHTRHSQGWPQRYLRVELESVDTVVDQAPSKLVKALAEAHRGTRRPTIDIPLNLLTASPRRIVAAVRERYPGTEG